MLMTLLEGLLHKFARYFAKSANIITYSSNHYRKLRVNNLSDTECDTYSLLLMISNTLLSHGLD